MERQRDGTYPRAEELVGLCMGFRFGCATTFRSPIHAGVLEHAGVFESVVVLGSVSERLHQCIAARRRAVECAEVAEAGGIATFE